MPVAGGAVDVAEVDVVVLVVVDVVVDLLLSPPPQPTASTTMAAPPTSANVVLDCVIIGHSLSSCYRDTCYPSFTQLNTLGAVIEVITARLAAVCGPRISGSLNSAA